MKHEAQVTLQSPPAQSSRRNAWHFAAVLAAVLIAFCALRPPKHYGDILEYMLTTVALANHATPDIRPGDVADTAALVPGFASALRVTAEGMRDGALYPLSGLVRTDHGIFAIHFFAYPALAALPFKALQAVGADPFRCFQLVNSAALFILGMSLWRLFGSGRRAGLFMLCYLLCGGLLYWQWSSPETMSAAGLLAGLILYTTGAPIVGGLLAGLGAMQNPPIIAFCLFAPLLRLSLDWRRDGLRSLFGWREIGGVVLCGALAVTPAVFDLVVFGTPSIIGKLATDPRLVTGRRLVSFFFDLNQGVMVGMPAVAAALLLWGKRSPAAWRVTLAAVAFAVAMALPALVATNWNSGADGIMRYALWTSMPLLFAFAWRARLAPRWPVALLAAVMLAQLAATLHIRRYNYLEFSPLAKAAMTIAPGWINPEPEIFFERVMHKDGVNDRDRIYAWPSAARPSKLLYQADSRTALASLCGPDAAPAAGYHEVDAGFGWRYINGDIACAPNSTAPGKPGLVLDAGWSKLEHGGGNWNGAWSDGPRARLSVRIEPRYRPTHIVLNGQYAAGSRTRVTIDGADLGWLPLDKHPELAVPPRSGGADTLAVELQFDTTTAPAAGDADQRHLGFFLHEVTMR
ncbi:hypothetical protein GCM10027321_19460 [Massilia terrae]|uniref:Uncharacterized protein n=1 Tax=Massilia terrae TaxID=1811224 RepID=A0ABT2CWP6_9BURK|nr:hypothetical protein [Massilia terrae]MCS0658407.1 hypothetical protein [Massilia terrae]